MRSGPGQPFHSMVPSVTHCHALSAPHGPLSRSWPYNPEARTLAPCPPRVGGGPSLTLAQLPISCVAIMASARPLPGGHLRAVGVGGAPPMVVHTGVHLWGAEDPREL